MKRSVLFLIAAMLLTFAAQAQGINGSRNAIGIRGGWLAGLQTGCTDPKDNAGKGANYAVVQDMAAKFRQLNGSIICAELLGLREPAQTGIGAPTQPQERNAEYYKKRPCVEMVRSAAQIFGEYLVSDNK